MRGTIARRLVVLFAGLLGSSGYAVLRAEPQPREAAAQPENATTTQGPRDLPETDDAPKESAVAQPSDQQEATGPLLRPRVELFVPSVRKLFLEIRRSHSGEFLDYVHHLIRELAGASAEGVNPEQAEAILAGLAQWPDAAIDGLTFAPDLEGRARWAIGVDWPVQALAAQLSSLLHTDAAQELFEGLRLVEKQGGAFVLRLGGEDLAHLLSYSSGRSYLASHEDLPLDAHPFTGSEETEADGPSLLLCRLNLTGTEKDSGATFFSSFNAVTDVVYSGRVADDGNWQESIDIHWPPISGMGVKALFGRVKQTFFVPREAFGAMVFKTLMAPGMLEGMVGFGPQVTFAPGGEMEVFGEQAMGPIAASVGSEMCVMALPGVGFLPMPDIVAQVRAKKGEAMMENIELAAEALNDEYRAREQREPWHVSRVRGRTVVWSDGASRYSGMMMPLVLRPVLFVAKDDDAQGKEREFLVIGWTSTSPERFVQRWLDFPRCGEAHVFLPDRKKTNGQFWIHWKKLYKFLTPYANLAMGAVLQDVLLPPCEQLEEELTDGSVTMTARFTGMHSRYVGPLPIGALVLPTMITSSMAPDESGGSDLARERLAAQRLKVFYHHARLFKEDLGRWPAELAELDGYIDFAGHPELLELQLSSRKGWSDMFDNFFGGDDKDKDDDEGDDALDDETVVKIDDELFVIHWGRDHWRLGLAEGTLEHIKDLYIDQEGRIHRVEKTTDTADDKKPETGERGAMRSGRVDTRRAVNTASRRGRAFARPHWQASKENRS